MIRTVEQYLDSLDDGRVVYCLGERVKDVRTHPTIRSVIRFAAMDYALPNDPRFRPLFVTQNEEGEEVNFPLRHPARSRGTGGAQNAAGEYLLPNVNPNFRGIF